MKEREDVIIKGNLVIPRATIFKTSVKGKDQLGKKSYDRIKKIHESGAYIMYDSEKESVYYYRDAEFDSSTVYISEEALLAAILYTVQVGGTIHSPWLPGTERIIVYDLESLSEKLCSMKETSILAFRWLKENSELHQVIFVTSNLEQCDFYSQCGMKKILDV